MEQNKYNWPKYSKYLLIGIFVVVCFYMSYQFKGAVVLLGMFAGIISLFALSKNRWDYPENNVDKLILYSPILIFISHYLLFYTFFY